MGNRPITEVHTGDLVWSYYLQEVGRVRRTQHLATSPNRLQEFDVRWSDHGETTYDEKDWGDVEIIELPDLTDPEAVEQWLSTAAPGAP